MMKGQNIVETVIELIIAFFILWIFITALYPAVCQSLSHAGAPNEGICSFFPTTSTTTSISTTSISTSTTTSVTTSTTTIVYNGTCNALSGFTCTYASLSQQNNLSINIGQNIVPIMYNIQLGCGATMQSDGAPNAQFKNFTFNLTSGQNVDIFNLLCSNVSTGTFSGYLWINYTKHSGVPSRLNNSYYTSEVASITIPS